MTFDINLEHLATILIVGVAGVIGICNGQTEAGYTLIGGLVGYAFKNGKVLIKQK
jgi:hypothetical protein